MRLRQNLNSNLGVENNSGRSQQHFITKVYNMRKNFSEDISKKEKNYVKAVVREREIFYCNRVLSSTLTERQ
jgi:hypothetical protein